MSLNRSLIGKLLQHSYAHYGHVVDTSHGIGLEQEQARKAISCPSEICDDRILELKIGNVIMRPDLSDVIRALEEDGYKVSRTTEPVLSVDDLPEDIKLELKAELETLRPASDQPVGCPEWFVMLIHNMRGDTDYSRSTKRAEDIFANLQNHMKRV